MPDDFGTILRRERSDAGRTMGDLARALGISVAFISKVESGKAPPLTRERIIEVAAFLRVNPVRLLTAAAKERNGHQLPSYGQSDLATRVATALARGSTSWTDEDFRRALLEAGVKVESLP